MEVDDSAGAPLDDVGSLGSIVPASSHVVLERNGGDGDSLRHLITGEVVRLPGEPGALFVRHASAWVVRV